MTDWSTLVDRLSQVLALLPGESTVEIVEAARPDEGRYATISRPADRGLQAEIGAAAPLAGDVLLIDAQQLLAGGWSPPDGLPLSHTRHPNWWYETGPAPQWPDFQDVAGRVVAGLQFAFGLRSPADLAYRAWQDGKPEELTCPSLLLPVVQVQYYAHLASPGDTPECPTGVLRRVRLDERVVDEECGRDLRWTPTAALSRPPSLGTIVPVERWMALRVVRAWRDARG